ncbi:hypothetical protein PHYSODRAFT_325215 [Phytophthora sojae]|uniref:Uncharacterized protein n=1 Tax=Phytophthora sojae (strain P6497) TaxID=1094619 RepID=G4Z161_PHYSP|nr:hypothetical protein PHYSODRAFT_325215 [Phytophthora sojae]EGZ24062.1 hypothetical protein PHYSODRAFT_325215 [Phytophthora sojae]|eukprot:XP_009519350.1 hypothetical protein PHYSODRAFT_325215 [Phytophthora sojae]
MTHGELLLQTAGLITVGSPGVSYTMLQRADLQASHTRCSKRETFRIDRTRRTLHLQHESRSHTEQRDLRNHGEERSVVRTTANTIITTSGNVDVGSSWQLQWAVREIFEQPVVLEFDNGEILSHRGADSRSSRPAAA